MSVAGLTLMSAFLVIVSFMIAVLMYRAVIRHRYQSAEYQYIRCFQDDLWLLVVSVFVCGIATINTYNLAVEWWVTAG